MEFNLGKEISILTRHMSIGLNNKQLDELMIHNDLLEAWSRRINLTGIHGEREIVKRHFLEGIAAGDRLRKKAASGTILDLGSGNGFPGVPMAVVCEEARPLILVESSEKRAAFLRALIRDLHWKDAHVEVRRVRKGSDLADLPCRIFTTRGVAVAHLLHEGLPFLESGGWCVLFASRASLEKESGTVPRDFSLEEEIHLPGREAGILLFHKG